MKLHKIYLFASVALATVLASCSDDEYSAGAQDDTTKPFAYLSSDNETTVEIDPVEATEMSFQVCRTDTTKAVDIPLTLEASEDGIFNLESTVHFEVGEDVKDVDVTFPNAKVGTTYTLRVCVEPEYSGIYKDVVREQTFSVTRVKWNDLGVGQLIDGFWYGYTFKDDEGVMIQQRDDNKLIYRFKSPYTDEWINTYNYDGDTPLGTGTYQENIQITTTKDGNATFDTFTINTESGYDGELKAYWDDDCAANSTVTYKTGTDTINYITLAPYWYIDGVGGWGTAANQTLILVFPNQAGPKHTYFVDGNYAGHYVSSEYENVAYFNVSFGEEITYVKSTLLTEEEYNEYSVDFPDYFDWYIDEGYIDAIESPEEETISCPYTSTGKYYLVVVGYDANDIAQDMVVKEYDLTAEVAPTSAKALVKKILTPHWSNRSSYLQKPKK